MPAGTTEIIIDGCSRVYFLEDTAKSLVYLRNVELLNVRHVYIKERAIAWSPYPRELELHNPGLRIAIRNSTVNEIASHAIKGRIDDIIISDSKINVLKPFALSSLSGVKHIELTNNIFDNIEIQTFKKFTTINFLLRGGSIRTIPSRFLSDVEVTSSFRVEGVNVSYITSLAFLVTGPKRINIERNNIENLEGDAFHIVTRGPITFRNNVIGTMRKGALLGFSGDPEVTSVFGPQELHIDNNTVGVVAPSSLHYDRSISLLVEGLNLNATCSCELAEEWHSLTQEGAVINCWYVLEGHFVPVTTYVETRCGAFKQNFWIFIVVGIVLICLVGVMIVIYIVKKENEKKKKLAIVMPDGKTYRETEFHIVVERAELLTTDL